MSQLKTKQLLGQLSDLEASLNGFSFEELNSQEAKALKNSFNTFKVHLNSRIFGCSNSSEPEEDVQEEKANKSYAQGQKISHTTGINDFLLKPYTLNELMIKLPKRKKEQNLTQASLQLLKQDTITASEMESVDLSLILKECYDDVQMLEELIRLFKQNVYEFIGAVKIGISNQNFEEVYLAAHKIKAGLALMNTKDLKNMILGIEAGCKQQEMPKVESLFQQFLNLYPQKEAMIDVEFKKLKQG